MSSESGLIIHKRGDVRVVEFLDSSLLDQASVARLDSELRSLVEKAGHPKIVISFEHVNFISSAVLGVLINLNKTVKEKGGELRLAQLPPKVSEVLRITRLDKLCRIFPTADAAVAKF